MITAYELYTGADGHSHFTRGSIQPKVLTEVEKIYFSETQAGADYSWHTAPTTQFVITLSGTLEFTVHSGESFILHPGEVLVAKDTTGSGHKWRLVDDQPWRRAYIPFNDGNKVAFIPDK